MKALGEAGIITSKTQTFMEKAVGFRNILAHRYGNVDHEIVYTIHHDDLHYFERFQQELAQWFQQHTG